MSTLTLKAPPNTDTDQPRAYILVGGRHNGARLKASVPDTATEIHIPVPGAQDHVHTYVRGHESKTSVFFDYIGLVQP